MNKHKHFIDNYTLHSLPWLVCKYRHIPSVWRAGCVDLHTFNKNHPSHSDAICQNNHSRSRFYHGYQHKPPDVYTSTNNKKNHTYHILPLCTCYKYLLMFFNSVNYVEHYKFSCIWDYVLSLLYSHIWFSWHGDLLWISCCLWR